jgi:ABC-type dipeptide/oligopeptide/nickel transport system ATPase component
MLLDVNLNVDYPGKSGALQDLRFSIDQGEIVGLVGESGSGKSTLALALLNLLDFKSARVRGSIVFEGQDLLALNERSLRAVRGRRISLVLQSPMSALNPMLRIGTHFKEAWTAHSKDGALWRQAAFPLLQRVCLPDDESFLRKRPCEISVGQAQRVLIAMALLHSPQLLIADEPTSALDVITQSETLGLFRELNRDLGTAMLIISHDLLSVSTTCSRVAIMESGRIVESGTVRQIFQDPCHPYTKRLINAIPRMPWSSLQEFSGSTASHTRLHAPAPSKLQPLSAFLENRVPKSGKDPDDEKSAPLHPTSPLDVPADRLR